MNQIFWQFALQIILIALNAVFACAEIAVISINKNKLNALADQGSKNAQRLKKLTEQPARFLATIQVAITLSGFLGSAFAADNFSDIITGKITELGVTINPQLLDSLSVIFITLILSYFTLIFGELVPKRIAMKKSEELALGLSAPITFVSRVFAPIVWLLTASTNGVLRIIGINPDEKEDDVSEEDICYMVDAGLQSGSIAAEEKNFIKNVFEFNDITVSEFATHRTEAAILYAEDSQEEWEKLLHMQRHTYYPVCRENADCIIGILCSVDYFMLEDKCFDNVSRYAMKRPYFVPESLYADVLFRQMKRAGESFAVLLDEYGGFSGIVTLNDLVEQLVGSLDDSCDEIIKTSEDCWEVSGSVPLKDAEEAFNTELPVDEYDTFGGYVFGLYGSIPDDGSTLEVNSDSLKICVTKIQNHRIEKAMVTLI